MLDQLPPREREIVDLLYAQGACSAAAIADGLSATVSDQAVRSMLARLEKKGFVTRHRQGRSFVYQPALSENTARSTALQRVVGTFFGGSAMNAASALIGMAESAGDEELAELEKLIADARASRRNDGAPK